MSPAPRTRPENILDGDHDQMLPPQRRSHYNRGCTHHLCREAFNDYQRDRRERLRTGLAVVRRTPRAETPDLSPAEPPAPARLAGIRVPALGATRRIQGLMRIGHSPVAIALASQVGVDSVWWLALGKLDTVDEVTHRIIDKAFRRLRQEQPEPRVKTAEAGQKITALSRELATEHGWVGPFDWDDIDNDTTPSHGYARATTARHHTKGGAA
jgi:hypothetical protein